MTVKFLGIWWVSLHVKICQEGSTYSMEISKCYIVRVLFPMENQQTSPKNQGSSYTSWKEGYYDLEEVYGGFLKMGDGYKDYNTI